MILFAKLSKLILLLLLSAHAVDAIRTTAINFLQQSGRVTIFNTRIGPEKLQTKVRIAIVAVAEVRADGVTHGTGGSPQLRHSLDTLDYQNFTLTATSSTVVGGVKAEKVSLVTQTGTGGTVTLETYVFLENGTFSIGNGDTYTVKENDVKFNVKLSSWTFCVAGALCGDKNATGNTTYIDVAVAARVLQGRRGDGDSDDKNKLLQVKSSIRANIANAVQNKTGKGLNIIDLGGNIPMYVSNQVQVDGVWQLMPGDFPKVDAQNAYVLYVLRFPKFNNEAVYDPVVAYSGADQATTTSGASSQNVVAWGGLAAIFLASVFA